jgi:hypothetical protein
MSDLFRDEALDHHARRRGAGEIRHDDAWIGRLFWVFIVVVLAGGVVAGLVLA